MNKIVEKVLARLTYERLLLVQGTPPRRRQITLPEFLLAGHSEPRVMAVLPAIFAHKPQIIRHLQQELKKRPRLKRELAKVLAGRAEPKTFYGIPAAECRRIATTFAGYLQKKQQEHCTRLINFRLTETDWQLLQAIAARHHHHNYSEALRSLIAQAV